MRYAIYFTPPASHPLSADAAGWLGRDLYGGRSGPAAHEWSGVTGSPRRYGFHATMKAPFRLSEGKSEADLVSAFEAFCARTPQAVIPSLAVSRIGPFFALTPDADSGAVDALAARTVEAFEPLRAPLTEAELSRRNPEKLTAAQRALLAEWGYPYVFGEFRFHMTLTGPVEDRTRAGAIEAELKRRFSAHTGAPLTVSLLSVFIEREPGAAFDILTQAPLAAAAEYGDTP